MRDGRDLREVGMAGLPTWAWLALGVVLGVLIALVIW
jgi:hypothetical protein